jgi:hypothetical protein
MGHISINIRFRYIIFVLNATLSDHFANLIMYYVYILGWNGSRKTAQYRNRYGFLTTDIFYINVE